MTFGKSSSINDMTYLLERVSASHFPSRRNTSDASVLNGGF